MRTTYQFSLLSIVWLFLIVASPLQAKVVYNVPPPQKVIKKKQAKKKYKKRTYKKRLANQRRKPASIQEGAPPLGTIIGWILFVWLMWWIVMAIPIILGLVFNLPWLWILGIVLGCLPLLLVVGVLLVILFGDSEPTPSDKKINTI